MKSETRWGRKTDREMPQARTDGGEESERENDRQTDRETERGRERNLDQAEKGLKFTLGNAVSRTSQNLNSKK